jgi:hypothetical protein
VAAVSGLFSAIFEISRITHIASSVLSATLFTSLIAFLAPFEDLIEPSETHSITLFLKSSTTFEPFFPTLVFIESINTNIKSALGTPVASDHSLINDENPCQILSAAKFLL